MKTKALILAAGLGSRLKEITQKTHKALLPINHIPNIERTIKYLKEKNIDEITIITGYLSEQFDYLKEKYNCKLIFNNHFKTYNSIYSYWLASKEMQDKSDWFVIDCDVVLFKNIFDTPQTNCYFTILRKKSEKKEWNPITDGKGIISRIDVTNRKIPSLLGISFWKHSSLEKINKRLNEYLSNNHLTNPNLYWDNIPMELISELNVKTKQLNDNEAIEIDDMDDYKALGALT